jgi:hypothetical protein
MCKCIEKSEGNGTKGRIVFVPFIYKWSRGRRRFHFLKTGAYVQTLKSEDKSAVKLQNRGSSTIAPTRKCI